MQPFIRVVPCGALVLVPPEELRRLREKGFSEDQEDGVICRWRHDASDLILDAMPARAGILGFENQWQAAALPHAIRRELPSGRAIRAASPPYLLATKLEAFKSRGSGDFLGSRDFGDVIALIDGRLPARRPANRRWPRRSRSP